MLDESPSFKKSSKVSGFGFLFQDQRFSMLKEKRESKNINNEILATLKKMDLEVLSVSQLLEVATIFAIIKIH